MRKFKNMFAAITAAAMTGIMTLSLVATAAPVISVYATVTANFTITADANASYEPNSTFTVTAEIDNTDLSAGTLSWTSSDESVATVVGTENSKTATVTILKTASAGTTTTITATYTKTEDSSTVSSNDLTVTVAEEPSTAGTVTGVTITAPGLTNKKITLEQCDSIQLDATIAGGSKFVGVNWEADSLQISRDGFLRIPADATPGDYTITATATEHDKDDAEVSDEITVTVTAAVVTKVEVTGGQKYIAPGRSTRDFSASSTNKNGSSIDNDTYTWKVEGASRTKKADAEDQQKENIEATYITNESGHYTTLHVGTKETAKELTITATSTKTNTVSASYKVTVFAGAILDMDYENMIGTIETTSNDSFLFLEVLKKDGNEKGTGTVYCYEGSRVDVDLSFLKISKDAYVLVYGDENTTPIGQYTIAAQPKKPSVKYVAGKDTIEDSFSVKNGDVKNLQYRTQYGTEWNSITEWLTMDELNKFTITGTTLMVRSLATDAEGEATAPPTAEVKVKISACPKAPKVTLDYAKNAIKLPKTSEIRVPSFNPLPKTDKEGNDIYLGEDVFYYTVGSGKADLTVSPEDLAEKLVTKYIEEYNAAQAKLDKSLQYNETTNEDGVRQLTTEYKKDASGKEIEGSNDKANLLEEMAGGYSLLIRTAAGKKAASQPAFVEVKAAPEIQIRQKKVGEQQAKDENGDLMFEEDGTTKIMEDIMEDENVVVVMTTKVNATTGAVESDYSSNTLTFTWSSTGLKLSPSGSATFAYSLDGEKFSKLSKETTIKLDKIDKSKSVVVRTEGVKENAKNNIIGNWASNELRIPVAVKTVTVTGDKEVTAPATGADAVEKEYKVTVKDFFDNEVKDAKVTWDATGLVTDLVEFGANAEGKQMLTVNVGAAAGKVSITATCGGVKSEALEVEVKANAASNPETPSQDATVTVTGKTSIIVPASGAEAIAETYTATVMKNGSEVSSAKITWSTSDISNNSAVTFDSATGKLTVAAGATTTKVTITATYQDGEKQVTGTCDVTLTSAE